ncbi:putative RNA-directed DNA polymerase from transposon BS [Colletotrichum aenigma]|uniref:putative RNA-directed DNA polymerase from transposon BS n=1 Tax=Colletotrichum aenigma TaxID=1215731 RepID=UPI001872169E|nr:putative RNA-directed DNA polymerase from transposon BS [Colletotrichum aenigma]KAF5527647.1 putative RNA-directed DNA polymerase from transposon BS [Colletotrichum aenigma]
MDVKGAFDSVLRNRLIVRLRQQGWPSSLIRLIYTFTSSRTACVRLEDTTTEDFPLSCGLPQGSPLSPILFLLYIADILADDRKLRFGYADDIGLVATSPSLEENATALGQEITSILSWGTENKVAFDPAKCEAIHFSRKHQQTTDLPDIQARGLTIKASIKPIRWLGVWFDRRLTFQHHVGIKVAAAKKVAYFLQHLTNTKGGLPAAAVRKAAIACALPIALYGAETWYAGLTRPALNSSTSIVGTGQKGLACRVGRVITAAARAILPVWRTTPTSALIRDAGLPTAEVALEAARLRFATRLQKVDQQHPLVPRLLQPGRQQTRLQRTAGLLPRCPRPALLQPQYPLGSHHPIVTQTKEAAARIFQAWLKTVPDKHTIIYSDGSKAPDGATGFGFVIYRKNKRIAQGCGRLSLAEVFDGEAEGARAGLRRALLTSQGQPIHICIDNTSVIQGIRGRVPDSSQAAFLEIQEAARTYDIRTHWSPGHEGIKGNEEADSLAKEGTTMPAPRGQLATLSGIKRLARERICRQYRKWWKQDATPRYTQIGLKASLACPPELALPRAILHHLLAARSGHGDFEQYHQRFNHTEALLTCSCGEAKEADHLVYCRKTLARRLQWPTLHPSSPQEPIGPIGSLDRYYKGLITDHEGFQAFLCVTDFFRKICPRY